MAERRIKQKPGKRITAALLAVLILSTLFLNTETYTSKANETNGTSTGGFALSLSWNANNNATDYEYNTELNENRLIRLNVEYSNKTVGEYNPGEIIITVPGIGAGYRGSIMEAASVAADKASTSSKIHEWSYTYNPTNDTYTFTNNKAIEANSTFAGSFEIVWNFNSRQTKQGYETALTAKLRAAGNVEAVSNEVTYKQIRVKDLYSITETVQRLYSTEGYDTGSLSIDDYYWVRYSSTARRQRKSLPVVESTEYYMYLIPEGGVIVYGNGYNFSDTGLTETREGTVYHYWKVDETVDKYSSDVNMTEIVVAYPKSQYADQTIKQYVQIYGRYQEDSAVSLLAETDISITANDYSFDDLPGDIYDVWKTAVGKGRYTQFALSHDSYCYSNGYVDARDVFKKSAKNTYTFNLQGLINYRSKEADFYDLEIVDDFIDIELKNGDLRQLQPDEYAFKTVTIPSTATLKNINGTAIKSDTYGVEIYVRTTGDSDFVLFDGTKKITSSTQTVTLPANTYRVKIKILGLTESITSWSIPLTVQFLLSDDDEVRTDGGRIINNMFFKLYRSITVNGTPQYEWVNDNFGEDTYLDKSNIDTYQRDIDEYGHSFDRESASLHILERPNFYYNNAILGSFTAVKGGFESNVTLQTTFDYLDDEELTKFSMYTILPSGIELPLDVIDIDAFFENLSISSYLGLSQSFLMNHLTIEFIKNYKNSGRTYVAFHFDFTDQPVIAPKSQISVTFPVYLSSENYQKYGGAYTLYGVSMIDDVGLLVNPSRYSREDNGNYSDDSALWRDINGNGNVTEKLSQDIYHQSIIYAVETSLQMTKFVATESTGWNYIQPEKNEAGDKYIEEQVPVVESSGDYSYKLRLKTGSSKAKDIVFLDVLETSPLKQWQGTFQNVDVSEALELLSQQNGRTVTATVYYSSHDYSAEIAAANNNYVPDFTTPDWTTVKPADPAGIKTVAVSFGDAVLDPNTYLSVYINMKAPDCQTNSQLVDKITENNYNLYYTPVDKTTEEEMPKVWLPSNDVPVKLQNRAFKLSLEKKDETGAVMAGAKFDFYKQLGGQPDKNTDQKLYTGLVTDARGVITVWNLDQGDYYFIETEAPKGYVLSSDPITVHVANDGQTVSAVNNRKMGQVTLKKVSDRNHNIAVPDAAFTLYHSDGSVYRDNITTGPDGTVTINDIPWGSYYLQEKSAPAGYVLNDEQYPFTISADKDNGSDPAIIILSDITVENEQIPASVIMTKYEMRENGTTIDRSVKLDGAAYKLYRESDNKELGTYVTDSNGEIYVGDLTFGSYYFMETIAAKGYMLNTNKISFTVDASHTTQSLNVETTDQRLKGNVWMQKLDDGGNYVADAVFGLYNAASNQLVSQRTTDAEGIVEFTNLNWGNYYIKEITAPKGYVLDTTEYTCTISRETVNDRIILNVQNERKKGSVKLVKVDETDANTKLAGAVFNLYKNDGSIYRSNLTTDVNGELIVDGIEWGSYYFQEIEAPSGYGLNPDKIRFSVNYLTGGVTQEFTVTDPTLSKELTLTKRIKISDIVFAHGNPTFTFTLSGTDINGKIHTYYKTVTISQDYLDQYLQDNPDAEYIEQSVIFAGLVAGTYTASETGVMRYRFDEITDMSANATITDETVVFDIITEGNGYATFVNEKNDQSGTSHTAVVTNIITKTRKLTAITVEANGLTFEDIPYVSALRSRISVYAIYDDGTQVRLAYNSPYVLDGTGLPTSSDEGVMGDFTVGVSYTEEGITRKTSFSITISIPPPYVWSVNYATKEATLIWYTGNSKIITIPRTVTGIRSYNENYDANWDSEEDKYVYGNDGVTYTVTNIAPDYNMLNGVNNFFMNPDLSSTVENVNFPDTLKEISSYSFVNCTALKAINIPDSVVTIGSNVFVNCTGAQSLKLPASLKTLGNYVFWNCTAVANDLVIPGGVTEMGRSVFLNCYNLKGDLVVPDGITHIREETFASSSTPMKFTSITIGNNVTSIGYNAFQNNSNATGNLVIPNSVTTIGASAFLECSKLTGDLVIPNGVTSIGSSAFYNCNSLNGNLVIPDSVKSIGASAFNNCYNLTGDLVIPSSVTSIGDSAFYNCNKFTGTLNIPSSITSIGKSVFYNCNNFTGLTIPNTVTSIGESAFESCYRIQGTVNIPGSVKSIGVKAFRICEFTGLTLNEGLETINDSAFYNCRFIVGGLKIPDSVTSIGNQAFYHVFSVNGSGAALVIGDGVITIGDQAFCGGTYNITRYSSITIGSSVQTIGKEAFMYNSNTTSITVPGSVTSIGTNAFANMTKLANLYLPSRFSPDTYGCTGTVTYQ